MNYLDECILLRRSVRRFTEQDIEKEKINREEFEALFEGKSEESNGE